MTFQVGEVESKEAGGARRFSDSDLGLRGSGCSGDPKDNCSLCL